MDDEYASFMAELGGGEPPPAPPSVDAAALASQAPWARPESDGGIGGAGKGAFPPGPPPPGPRPPAPWATPQGGMPPRPPPAPWAAPH
eukprot:5733030-Prymnesium_polylepis.1